MMTFKPKSSVFVFIVCSLMIQSNSFSEPGNLGLLKQTIKEYHDSGTYETELESIISVAEHYVIGRASSNQTAQQPQKLALILDIDETSLSYYNAIVKHDFSYNKKQFDKAIMAANAPAIQPVLNLYQTALKQNVAVFFITGRSEEFQKPTEENLKSAGYQQWTAIYLKPTTYKEASIVPFKSSSRADITKQGYTIIASIGDQHSDLSGGYAEKTFKLPNPYYHIP
jgi:acid phosphatase